MNDLLASFTKSPFNLDGNALDWVQSTFAGLENRTKSGLVFAKFAFGPNVGPAESARFPNTHGRGRSGA